MLGLTTLGLVHTAISLVAVAAGLVELVREGAISTDRRAGRIYVGFTVLTCLTALGIFQHGGFGPPHAVALLTLAVLAVVALARHTRTFGAASAYVEVIGYSATFLFHLIPAITETATRLPAGAPLLASADAPELKTAYGVLFLVFLVGAAAQTLRLRGSRRAARA